MSMSARYVRCCAASVKAQPAARAGAGRDARADTEWPRCVRCDALMMDREDRPRRGRRRLYCSDTCRRDSSAARMAAERHGTPIRVVEVPRAGSDTDLDTTPRDSPASVPISALDAADIASRDERALCALLVSLTERARRKDLERATLTATRDLAKVVYPYRS